MREKLLEKQRSTDPSPNSQFVRAVVMSAARIENIDKETHLSWTLPKSQDVQLGELSPTRGCSHSINSNCSSSQAIKGEGSWLAVLSDT